MLISYLATAAALSAALIAANRNAAPERSHLFDSGHRCRQIGDITCLVVAVYIFTLLLLLSNRLIFSTFTGAALIAALWAGNRLKVAVLDECLVFSDVFLAGHALRYPRLYFGYAPTWIWPLLVLAAIVIIGGAYLEPPFFPSRYGIERCAAIATLMLLLTAAVIVLSTPNVNFLRRFASRFPLTFDTQEDTRRYTPIGAGLLHTIHHGQYRFGLRERFKRTRDSIAASNSASPSALKLKTANHHYLFIQAESFVRIDRLLGRRSVTPVIDGIAKRADHGALKLDWRGAYTMRSEFAVLTGIAPRALQTYGFDPYRLAAMENMESIAWKMKRKGYRTVVCHPNDARFFDRDKVMPHLGFDEFIDLSTLTAKYPHLGYPDSKCGHYVKDSELLAWAVQYLKTAARPTFLFLVTIEAHGPWDRSSFPGAEKLTETERYEEHLKHLDQGVAAVLEAQRKGLSVKACLYGDHLPGIKELQARADEVPADTFWLCWDNIEKKSAYRGSTVIPPESLVERLLLNNVSSEDKGKRDVGQTKQSP